MTEEMTFLPQWRTEPQRSECKRGSLRKMILVQSWKVEKKEVVGWELFRGAWLLQLESGNGRGLGRQNERRVGSSSHCARRPILDQLVRPGNILPQGSKKLGLPSNLRPAPRKIYKSYRPMDGGGFLPDWRSRRKGA